MDQDGTWHGGPELGLSPGDFVLDGDPPLPKKGGGAPPHFRSISIVNQQAIIFVYLLRIQSPRGARFVKQ